MSRASNNTSHFSPHTSNHLSHDLQCVPTSSIPQVILRSDEVTRASVNVTIETGSDQQGILNNPRSQQHQNISVRLRNPEEVSSYGLPFVKLRITVILKRNESVYS